MIPFDFYPETEWRDDLELGATELALATAHGHLPAGLPHRRSRYYLRQAAHWAHAYITGPNDAADTLNLYDVERPRPLRPRPRDPRRPRPARLQVTPRRAARRSATASSTGARRRAARDPFGFGFPWAAYDTTSHGFGLA